MKKFNLKKYTLLIVALFSASVVSAQGMANLRISEVMVKNTEGVGDAYGEKVGWIELHNTGYTTLNLAGLHLSIADDVPTGRKGALQVDKNAGYMTYVLPKSAGYMMNLPPQGYMLVYAGGGSERSPFSSTFTLDETGHISIWDASGKVKITSLDYDVDAQRENVSMVLTPQKDGSYVIAYTDKPTPGQSNIVEPGISKSEQMKIQDPNGFGMTITAVSVVFLALILLYLIFRTVGKIMQKKDVKKDIAATVKDAPAVAATARMEKVEGDISGEIAAAIAFAIKTYQDDLEAAEQMALTLNRVAKVYSPWSSKIHGLTREPERR